MSLMFRNDGIGEVKTLLRGGNFVIFGEALTDPRKGNANQVKKVYNNFNIWQYFIKIFN